METLMRGSERDGWKSARICKVQGNSLAVYSTVVSHDILIRPEMRRGTGQKASSPRR
jgi:hypothetical protein